MNPISSFSVGYLQTTSFVTKSVLGALLITTGVFVSAMCKTRNIQRLLFAIPTTIIIDVICSIIRFVYNEDVPHNPKNTKTKEPKDNESS